MPTENMVLALDTLPRKLTTLLLALAASVPLSISLWSQYRADFYSRQGTVEALQQAIAMQPGNAELHNRLGRTLLYSPSGDVARAKGELERAAALDPRTAGYTIDVALDMELAGDFDGAARAIERARRAEPRTPAILWHELNYWLRREQNERALGLARELLQMAPEYTGRAVPLLLRVTTGSTLLDQVVPKDVDAYGNVLEAFRREDRVESAAKFWQRALELGRPLPEGQVRMFVDWMLVGGHADLALRAWTDAVRNRWIAVDPQTLDEPFYNADFRYTLLNFGFDWRVQPHPDASVWVQLGGPRGGQQSLCVQFSQDARGDYAGVFHFVPVKPATQYELRASMRTDKLVSSSGAWLQVQELAPGRSVTPSTDPLMGTNAWKEVLLQFETGPETKLARLTLVRPAPSLKEPPASGLVCVAPLEWKSLGPARQTGATGAQR
jgi:tetratricopeptide (TPR) repeat protein